MIDVLVPPLDRAYDLEIAEEIKPKELLKKTIGLISEYEGVNFSGYEERFFSIRSGDFLKEDVPLASQNIGCGDRLILI